MKLFLSYLKIHIKPLVLFLLFTVIFFAVTYLYSYPAEAVIYTFVLCSVPGIITIVYGFIKFKRKHKIMSLIAENIMICADELPEPVNILEEDYTYLIKELKNSMNSAQSDMDSRLRDINDYYTLWVHQIKTPIAAMRLLLQQNENDEISEQLFRIEQYVEMALNYIRCGNDASDYVFKKCRLDDIIKSAVKKYTRSFIRKRLPLKFAETSMTVVTDEKWLTFVIEQIISNALKYTKEGCISIYAESGKYLVIKDTGIGISPQDLPRITEKGYTGYNGRLDKKSTGIGLFLSKKILDSLGHTLKITSEEGKGTAVRIEFSNPNIKYE